MNARSTHLSLAMLATMCVLAAGCGRLEELER